MRAELMGGIFAGWGGGDRFVGVVLSLLLLFLPLFDPPTNVFLLTLLIVLVVSLARTPANYALRELDAGHLAFGLLLLASLVSTLWNLPYPDQFRGVREVFGFLIVYLMVSRLPVSERTIRWFFWCLIVGALLAALWGGVDLARQKTIRLEMHAIGGAARAGIYLALILIAGFGLLAHAFSGKEKSLRQRILVVGAWVALGVALYLTGSRGAMLAVAVGLVVYGVPHRQLIGRRLIIGLLVLAAVSTLVLSLLPGHMKTRSFVSNTIGQLKSGELDQNDSLRLTLQKYGVEVFRQAENPWLGVGPRNFHVAKPSVPDEWAIVLKDFEGRVPHAHNLFINRLAEEGIVGLGALLLLFGVVGRWLWQDARAGRATTLAWSIGLGGLLAPIIAGSFNTPWFRENALLATICFALYAAARRQSAAGRQPA